jgi:D-alanyl-D-alanine dipeptidase
MGSSFDLFDGASMTIKQLVSDQVMKHRKLLLHTMVGCGFRNYELEWWHYTLINEPFPKEYFNFAIV